MNWNNIKNFKPVKGIYGVCALANIEVETDETLFSAKVNYGFNKRTDCSSTAHELEIVISYSMTRSADNVIKPCYFMFFLYA